MTDGDVNPELERRWQSYLRRRKIGKYLLAVGGITIIVSIFIGLLPVAVAAFSGTVFVSTPWDSYFGIGLIFGFFLILAGIIARIAPNMMEGDSLWVLKMGPFGDRS